MASPKSIAEIPRGQMQRMTCEASSFVDSDFLIYREARKNNVQTDQNFAVVCKLTWLVLGGDPAARSHRVEQFTAL